jgi:hypothetical protein
MAYTLWAAPDDLPNVLSDAELDWLLTAIGLERAWASFDRNTAPAHSPMIQTPTV